jgi:hypothetical protein
MIDPFMHEMEWSMGDLTEDRKRPGAAIYLNHRHLLKTVDQPMARVLLHVSTTCIVSLASQQSVFVNHDPYRSDFGKKISVLYHSVIIILMYTRIYPRIN